MRPNFIIALIVLICMHSVWGSDVQISEESPPVQRLIEAEITKRNANPPVELKLLGLAWEGNGATVQRSVDELHVEILEKNGRITVPLEIDATDYTTLHVEMQVSSGAEIRLYWENDQAVLAKELSYLPSAKRVSYSGSAFHAYEMPLNTLGDEQWVGKISKLHFVPSDEVGEFSLRKLALRYDPAHALRRMELDQVTREVIFGTQAPWRLRVPEGGHFESWLAMHKRAWNGPLKGTAEVRVRVEDAIGTEKLLYKYRLSPNVVESQKTWVPIHLDLGEYAQQEVTLHLEVDSLGVGLGDWVYWGGPMVYSQRQEESDIPVILISIDTLRADHMSVYGYERDTTPKLAAWAQEEAVVFETAITTQSWTLPAHMSMLSGLIPPKHRVSESVNLEESVVTLPEALRESGYVCSGFVGHKWWLLGKRGFAQGFDVYDVPESVMRHLYETDTLLQDWLDVHSMSRQFIFFHCYDVHSKLTLNSMPWARAIRYPYDSGDMEFNVFSKELKFNEAFQSGYSKSLTATKLLEAYNAKEITFDEKEHALVKALYDDSIRMVDQGIFEIFESLKRRGLYDNALIIVTSDHGESLGERETYGHFDVFEDVAHVPLIVRFPDKKYRGMRYTDMVSTVSIYATVLDVLGLKEPHEMDGPSLLALLDGREAPPDYVYLGRQGYSEFAWATSYSAIRTREWKLRHTYTSGVSQSSLYDVNEKPYEQSDVSASNAGMVEQLAEHLKPYLFSDEGWNLFVKVPDGVSKLFLKFEAEGGLQNAAITWDGKTYSPMNILGGGVVELQLEQSKEVGIILRPTNPDSKLRIENAGAPITLTYNGNTIEVEDGVGGKILPGDVGGQEPSGARGLGGVVVGIWRVAPERDGGEALEASPEMEESLRALGYLE